MQKEVLFGKESRDKTLAGVQKITAAVKVTMGAAGKCVLIGNAIYGNEGVVHLPTLVTKDGWTVTKHFELPDPMENRGAMMIREGATKTMIEAGDATTATCVLAENIITNGMKLIDEGANSQELKKGMDKALIYVIEELKKLSIPVRGNIERIRQIATVSANNDSSIGDLIAEAYSKIGDDGIIDIEESKGIETEVKISGGFKFDKGWVSPLFINVGARNSCEFENPFILLYDKKITHHTQVEAAVKISIQQNKALLIICDGAEAAGLSYLAVNTARQQIRACIVTAPEFGDSRREWMEDIALLTGGTYISDIRGIKIKEITQQHFGSAQKIIVSRTETIIREGFGSNKKVEDFVNDLRMNLTQAKTETEKRPIENRIARLTSGVAVIHVGAATETELNEKIDRVDDSVRATKSAIAEGFIAGGGTAFIRIRQNGAIKDSKTDFGKGMQLLFSALSKPLLQICENSGIDSTNILEKVLSEKDNIGYNALTGQIEDMVESGIIDSTKALRCALVNAASVAGMVLTSECSIISKF